MFPMLNIISSVLLKMFFSCNGVGVSGLSGALAIALVAAIFWGQVTVI